MMTECPCGQPWALDRYDVHMRRAVDTIVRARGLYLPVLIFDRNGYERTFMVSRYCIAYHGVTAEQLLSGTSGFLEVYE